MSYSFIPFFMTSMKSFNYNQLKNIKVKSELNPNALEFIPENIKKDNNNLDKDLDNNLDKDLDNNLDKDLDKKFDKDLDKKFDKKFDKDLDKKFDNDLDKKFDKDLDNDLDKKFDNLEKDFVKNNNWLFYV